MLLISTPQCNIPRPAGKQIAFTSSLARPALRSLQYVLLSSPRLERLRPQPETTTMSSPRTPPRAHSFGSPRSPTYSPSLAPIPEVTEFESLERITSQPTTPLESSGSTCVLPEPAQLVSPTVSKGPKTKGIICSPRKKCAKCKLAIVPGVLRKVLKADRERRRSALRVYLKLLVFMRMLMKSHERYGTILAAQGGYMQR